jgi:hypothetical protein
MYANGTMRPAETVLRLIGSTFVNVKMYSMYNNMLIKKKENKKPLDISSDNGGSVNALQDIVKCLIHIDRQ